VPLEQQPQGVKDILLVIGDENSRLHAFAFP